MDKTFFVQTAFEDVSFLIENYLKDGQFVSFSKWEELDEFIYGKFPYLSIAFLIKSNVSDEDYKAFVSKYHSQISGEVKIVKELLLKDIDYEVEALSKEKKDLFVNCEKLQKSNELLNKCLADSEKRIVAANKEIEKLRSQVKNLEQNRSPLHILTKEQIVVIWSNFYTLPYINDNAIINETIFDIEGFIEDLSTKFSIYITSEELLSNNSLKKVIDLLQSKQSRYKDNFNKLLKQYPHKKETVKEINVNNVTQIILSCCPKKNGATPKYVFGTDTLENAKLDVEKLNSVLYYNFGLKWSSVASIRSTKNIDELKIKILSWQQMKISPTSSNISASAIAASVAIASSIEKLKLSPFFHPKKGNE